MIQYPKHEHVTLPSVESWGQSMNILRDPHKSIWTRKIDKVGSTSQIVEEIGNTAGDRISEYIKVYPRGINPMVSVSYSNNGTNGGQSRAVTGAGFFGKNKMSSDGRRPYLGQAKLPYQIGENFRPPTFRQEDLLPLSRLPRTNTEAWTQPGFIDFAKGQRCNFKPEKNRAIVNDRIQYETDSRAFKTIQQQTKVPYEVRQVISNPLHYDVTVEQYAKDSSMHVNPEYINRGTREYLTGEIKTNMSAPRMVEYMLET